MGHKKCRSFLVVLIAGCVVTFGFRGSLSGADPSTDPFVALRVSRVPTGHPMGTFDLKALDGGTLRSADLIGKVVLLNFWATWCGPCKEEMPSLGRLQEQFDSARVRVVTVTADMYPQGIRQFLDQLGVRLPVGFDQDQELSRKLSVRGLPTTVVIGQDGHIVGRAVGPRLWDSSESIALVRQVLAADIP
ncbi:MAG TPA: TlpA disulfide reductase family protein [Nitrospira sp.]|nr:TlpA disulfide reductase family protein [Nitrospira sp.]